MNKTQEEYSVRDIGDYIIEIKKYYGSESNEYITAYETWIGILNIIELKEELERNTEEIFIADENGAVFKTTVTKEQEDV